MEDETKESKQSRETLVPETGKQNREEGKEMWHLLGS